MLDSRHSPWHTNNATIAPASCPIACHARHLTHTQNLQKGISIVYYTYQYSLDMKIVVGDLILMNLAGLIGAIVTVIPST